MSLFGRFKYAAFLLPAMLAAPAWAREPVPPSVVDRATAALCGKRIAILAELRA